MLTTKTPFPKVGQQQGVTYALSPHPTIVASNASQTTVLGSTATTNRVRIKQIDSEVTTAMLESEAFKVPVDNLVNIWVLRFGHDWVELERIEEDSFFSLAFKRLKQLGEVEVHFLTDRARYVCRMPE